MTDWGGFDTETQDGKAVLVGTDRDALLFPKSFAAIAHWLLGDGRRDFAAYNMAYDARAILHFLPLAKISQLNRTLVTEHGGFEIEYVPRKLLEIRQREGKKVRSVRVWDVWVFYGGSLDKTARKVLGEGKQPVPRSWMPRMGAVLRSPHTRARAVRYCQKDADLARRLHDHLRGAFDKLKLSVKRPYSPGSYAVEYFRDDIPIPPPDWVQDTFRASFFGGRIEIFKRGKLAPVWLYDVKSAYPHAAKGLPTTDGAAWVEVEPEKELSRKAWKPTRGAVFGSYKVQVTVDPSVHIPFLPLRARDGSISYPCGTFETWTDLESLVYARGLPGHDIRVLDGLECVHEDKPAKCYGKIPLLFRLRKEKPELDLPAKLILNSLYGKLASTRDRWEEVEEPDNEATLEMGRYYTHKEEYSHVTNFPQAAAITARTRIRLHRAAMLDPGAVAAFATDGIVATRPLRLPLGSALGDWTGPEKFTRAVLVLAGVGFYRRGRETKQVMRGMRLEDSLEALLSGAQGRKGPVVKFSQRAAVGIAEYLRKKDKATFNVLLDTAKRLDVNADSKRVWPSDWRRASELLTQSQDSTAPVMVEA